MESTLADYRVVVLAQCMATKRLFEHTYKNSSDKHNIIVWRDVEILLAAALCDENFLVNDEKTRLAAAVAAEVNKLRAILLKQLPKGDRHKVAQLYTKFKSVSDIYEEFCSILAAGGDVDNFLKTI